MGNTQRIESGLRPIKPIARNTTRTTSTGRIVTFEMPEDQLARVKKLGAYLRVNRSAVLRQSVDALWAMHGAAADWVAG